jgi:two-component system sensor histidine kinase GlrK
MKARLPIFWKMMIGFGVIILVLILASTYILLDLEAVSQTARNTLGSDVLALTIANKANEQLGYARSHGEKFLILRDSTYYGLFEDVMAEISAATDSLRLIDLHDEHIPHLTALSSAQRDMVNLIRQARVLPQRTARATSPADTVRELQNRLAGKASAVQAALEGYIGVVQHSIGNSMDNVQAITRKSTNVASLLILGSFVIAVAAAFLLARTITKPIDTLIRGADQIARGVFDPVHVQSRDEIALLAGAINEMSARLKQINELKAEIMQQISHELRTPLQAMLSAHYLLHHERVGSLNDAQKQLLESMKHNIEKLTRFSHQFLDIAKIEAGMMEYHLEKLDILSIIQPTVENARLIASQKQISVRVDNAPTPVVKVDPDRMSQVFSNLLSNAIKYTDAGGVITVAVGPCQFGVRVTVADNGPGIAPDDLPKIFTKFYQARNAGQASTKGTGIGLALVKAFVEGHGGRVFAESTVGKGSVFTVELPLTPATPAPDDGKPELHGATA